MPLTALKKMHCEICGESVAPAQVLVSNSANAISCGDFTCQRLISQKPTMNSQLFAAQSAFQSKCIGERRAKEAARKQHIEHIKTTEALQNQAILESILDQRAELKKNPLKLLAIPCGLAQMLPSNKQRVENYTQHLRDIIQQAFQDPTICDADSKQDASDDKAPEPSLTTELQSISDALCTLCKGGCCSAGADRAYLSANTIRRLIDIDALASEQTIFDAYVNKLPAASIDTACINQTDSGCALPRELRSDTCNAYYCEPLQAYQKDMSDTTKPQRILAIQRSHAPGRRFDSDDGNKILCVALVDEHGAQELDIIARKLV